jgi:hypothetical protein
LDGASVLRVEEKRNFFGEAI